MPLYKRGQKGQPQHHAAPLWWVTCTSVANSVNCFFPWKCALDIFFASWHRPGSRSFYWKLGLSTFPALYPYLWLENNFYQTTLIIGSKQIICNGLFLAFYCGQLLLKGNTEIILGLGAVPRLWKKTSWSNSSIAAKCYQLSQRDRSFEALRHFFVVFRHKKCKASGVKKSYKFVS